MDEAARKEALREAEKFLEDISREYSKALFTDVVGFAVTDGYVKPTKMQRFRWWLRRRVLERFRLAWLGLMLETTDDEDSW